MGDYGEGGRRDGGADAARVPLAPPGPARSPGASLSHGGLLQVRALLYKVEALSSRSPLRRKEPRSNAARAGSGKRATRPVSRAVNKTTRRAKLLHTAQPDTHWLEGHAAQPHRPSPRALATSHPPAFPRRCHLG
ncbi:unnamed protein product [Lampetra planeri]